MEFSELNCSIPLFKLGDLCDRRIVTVQTRRNSLNTSLISNTYTELYQAHTHTHTQTEFSNYGGQSGHSGSVITADNKVKPRVKRPWLIFYFCLVSGSCG